jgi:hypothetical protein
MPAWPIKSLTIDGQVYRPVGPEWSGFYDWLRTGDGVVVGVRYHPTEETRFLLEEALALDYAAVGRHKDLCIYFGENRTFDPDQSEDQDFAYDQVFVTPSRIGSGICFSTENLTEAQVSGLTSNLVNFSVEASYPSPMDDIQR